MPSVNSTTIVALAGIAGTAGAAALGMLGVIRAASINARAQHHVQDQQYRRQAYAACAAAFLARHDAAEVPMHVIRRGELPPEALRVRAQELADVHLALMEKVGAVTVEGPRAVAGSAENAAKQLAHWIGRLQSWADSDDPAAVAEDQYQYALVDQQYAEEAIERFTAASRRVLHPRDDRRPRRSPYQVFNGWQWNWSERRTRRLRANDGN